MVKIHFFGFSNRPSCHSPLIDIKTKMRTNERIIVQLHCTSVSKNCIVKMYLMMNKPAELLLEKCSSFDTLRSTGRIIKFVQAECAATCALAHKEIEFIE